MSNQNSLVQPWESCPKTRFMPRKAWVSIREGGPEILKHGVT